MQTDIITNRYLKHLSDIKPGGLFTFNDGYSYVNPANGHVFTSGLDIRVLPLYQTSPIMLSIFDPEAV